MYHHMSEILDRAEMSTDQGELYAVLRDLPLEDFVHAVFYPDDSRPALSERLPTLPSDQVQRNWVGDAGPRLEQMTSIFVRNVAEILRRRYGESPPSDLKILDYGCGWGRILRTMPYFTAPENIYGVDPVQESLEHCIAGRVSGHLALCEPIPTTTPFPEKQFDLVYAFSVFTHLSEKTCGAVLSAVREAISPNGVFIITIRPIEFWPLVEHVFGAERIAEMERLHRLDEFAFSPVNHLQVGAEATFGDASWSMKKMHRLASDHGWRVDPQYLHSMVDPYQIVVPLYPL